MNIRRYGRLVLLLALASCSSPGETTPPPSTPTPAAAGLYTIEQAERGERVFTMICSTCHGRNDFTGRMFELTWMAEPIGTLFQHISAAMPQDDPGSLSPEEYASVVAYLLQVNGRPAGDRELPTDVDLLGAMRW